MLKMYYFMLKLPKINTFCKRMVNFIALNKNVNINCNELYNNFFTYNTMFTKMFLLFFCIHTSVHINYQSLHWIGSSSKFVFFSTVLMNSTHHICTKLYIYIFNIILTFFVFFYTICENMSSVPNLIDFEYADLGTFVTQKNIVIARVLTCKKFKGILLEDFVISLFTCSVQQVRCKHM